MEDLEQRMKIVHKEVPDLSHTLIPKMKKTDLEKLTKVSESKIGKGGGYDLYTIQLFSSTGCLPTVGYTESMKLWL